MADRIEVASHAGLDRAYPQRWGCELTAESVTGEVRRVLVEDPRGDPRRPLSDAELQAKFLAAAEPVDAELASAVRHGALAAGLDTPVAHLARTDKAA